MSLLLKETRAATDFGRKEISVVVKRSPTGWPLIAV